MSPSAQKKIGCASCDAISVGYLEERQDQAPLAHCFGRVNSAVDVNRETGVSTSDRGDVVLM
jgi:hypothetical protein